MNGTNVIEKHLIVLRHHRGTGTRPALVSQGANLAQIVILSKSRETKPLRIFMMLEANFNEASPLPYKSVSTVKTGLLDPRTPGPLGPLTL